MRSMTAGHPLKLIVLFSIPLLIGNLFQQVYSLTDMFIVGQHLGEEALAAVGAMIPIFFMAILIATGFTRGLAIVTAQRFGAGDEKGVRRSFTTGMLLSGIFSFLVMFTMVNELPEILMLMKVPDNIFEPSFHFMQILSYALFATVYYNYLSAVMQSLGDSKTPLYFLIFACVMNVALNLYLIIYMGMDVRGSAIGTALAQGVSMLLCFIYMMWKFPLLRTKRKDWKLRSTAVIAHLKLAIPLALQFAVVGFGIVLVQRVCNTFGSGVIAAFAASVRVEQLSTMPLFALSMGLTTFVAQNYGAGNIRRIRQSVWQCSLLSFVLSVLATIVVYFWGKNIVALFMKNPAPEIIDTAQTYLQITTLFFFFLGQVSIYRQTLSGMGNALLPLIACVMELVMRAFAAVYLSNIWGFVGICYAGPIAWIGGATVVAVGYFWTILKYQKALLPKMRQKYKKAV